MQVSEPTGGVAAGQENPGDRTRPPGRLARRPCCSTCAAQARRVTGDGFPAVWVMTAASACGCRHGHAHSNSRVAAEPAAQPPKEPAGSPASRLRPASHRRLGHRHCSCPRRVVRCPVPRRRARGPRPHHGHQPIRSLCWKRLRFGPVPVGEQHLAAAVSQGGQLADPFRDRSGKQRRHSGCRRRQRCDPQRPVDGKADHAPLQRHVRQAAGDNSREIAEPPLLPAPVIRPTRFFHNLRQPCGHPVNKRGCVSEGLWPTRTRLSLEFAAASA